MPVSGESEPSEKKIWFYLSTQLFSSPSLYNYNVKLFSVLNVFIEDLNTRRQIFFYFKTLMCSIKIQCQEKSHMFDQFSQLK